MGGYAECQARREAFSNWLSEAAESKIQAETAGSVFKVGCLNKIVSEN